MTYRRPLTVALAGLVVLAACSSDDSADDTTSTAETTTTTSTVPETTPTTTPPPSTSSTSTTTTTLPEIIRQPLTGEPVDSEADLVDRAALAVKIDNHPSARANHTGLANADIVFEEIVEGQLTRFLAIFHTTGSDPVGPIRSGRSQDVGLLASFNEPLFAWSGGNAGVTSLIANSPLVDLNAVRGGQGYYRGPGGTPHNLYNDTETLWAQTPEDHPGPPEQQYAYLRPEETFTGEEVAGMNVVVGGVGVGWEWDADSGKWLRNQGGRAHNDVTNGRIAATNVVVMTVSYVPSAIDSRSPEAVTVGEGHVFVFSDGKVAEGTWARLAAQAPIEFLDEAGEPLLLSPGNTWIELAAGFTQEGSERPVAAVETF
ncbi:MAG: DUF3048 domain-containing protein [Ilumatobacteraceae bacterium]